MTTKIAVLYYITVKTRFLYRVLIVVSRDDVVVQHDGPNVGHAGVAEVRAVSRVHVALLAV